MMRACVFSYDSHSTFIGKMMLICCRVTWHISKNLAEYIVQCEQIFCSFPAQLFTSHLHYCTYIRPTVSVILDGKSNDRYPKLMSFPVNCATH